MHISLDYISLCCKRGRDTPPYLNTYHFYCSIIYSVVSLVRLNQYSRSQKIVYIKQGLTNHLLPFSESYDRPRSAPNWSHFGISIDPQRTIQKCIILEICFLHSKNSQSMPCSRYVRIPNRTENTETATESAQEYQIGHRIGSRIPNRPSISVSM